METELVFDNLCRMVIEGDFAGIQEVSRQALTDGIDPLAILEKGISRGMEIVGKKFEAGDAFLPELLLAADAFSSAMKVVTPALEASRQNVRNLGKIILATVKGDVHDLGKNILAKVLETNGFEVVDLGVNQSNLSIVERAREQNADVIGLSAVMTTTMPYQKELIDILVEMGIRDRFIVLVGGGPVNQRWAEKIGADGYGRTAMDAVAIATQKIGQKQGRM